MNDPSILYVQVSEESIYFGANDKLIEVIPCKQFPIYSNIAFFSIEQEGSSGAVWGSRIEGTLPFYCQIAFDLDIFNQRGGKENIFSDDQIAFNDQWI